jgi:hypothetical protein
VALHAALAETSWLALPQALAALVALSRAFPACWGYCAAADPPAHLRALHESGQRGSAALFAQLGLSDFYLPGNGTGGLAAVTRCLAPHQVIGLDGSRAFVDGQNFGIAVVLRSTGFFNEAHAAVHLHAQ